MRKKATIGIHAKLKYQIRVINVCNKYFEQKCTFLSVFTRMVSSHANLLNHKKVLDKDKVQLPQEPFRTAPTWPLFVVIGGREVMWKLSTSEAWSCQVTAQRVFPYNSINLRYDNRPYPYHLLSRKNQDMCDHEKWRWNWRIFRLVRIMGKTVSFVDIECSVIDQFRYIKIHTILGFEAKGNKINKLKKSS